MRGRTFGKHGLVLSKVPDGRHEVGVRRLGLDDLRALLLDDVLDEFVERPHPVAGAAVRRGALDGPEHAPGLVVLEVDDQVLVQAAVGVVFAVHGSVFKRGFKKPLGDEASAVRVPVAARRALVHFGFAVL